MTYKCAWRIGHQIRKLMAEEEPTTLQGQIEIDEAYFGGVRKGQGRGPTAGGNKPILVGMVKRGGDAKMVKVDDVKQETLRDVVLANVAPPSAVITDELSSYNLVSKVGYTHGRVYHSAGEYVRGPWHTNSIEGFWARLKNSIKGTHVHVSGKYVPRYAAEFSYRHNMRKQPEKMFNRLFSAISER